MTSKFSGTVSRGPRNVGSKSEFNAVQLETKVGPLILRRPGGNPFKDEVLDELVGKHIHCKGSQKGKNIFLSSWQVDESDAK